MPTFYLTDIENSTRLWQQHGEAMARALLRHDALVQAHIQRHGGQVVKHTGDGFFAVFPDGEPLACAIRTQAALARQEWGAVGELRVRIAIHCGEAERRGKDYFGAEVNRTARILSAAWGGQILLSQEASRRLPLPDGASLEDLGTHRLKDLERPQRLYLVRHPALPLKEFPPLRSLSARPNNLPPQSTPFVGREAEVAAIRERLLSPECRLLTLVGPGGVGKTRLALQSAADLIDRFPDGVYLVELAPLQNPHWALAAIAHALGFTPYSKEDTEAQLRRYLEDKRILLVLDNFEHIIPAAALVGRLLQGAPRCRVLATSRQPLHLQGEHILRLEGLPARPKTETKALLPPPAWQLFEQSARRVAPEFRLTEANRAHVEAICQLVDGIPLAIELAAGWVQTLSCARIAQELRRSPDILASSRQDVAERHRSLRHVFEYSWQLLSAGERQALQTLNLFPASFTLEAARQGAGVGLPLMAALLEKSLLRKLPRERYQVFQALRHYVAEKGAPERGARLRLCRYYAEWMRAQAPALQAEQQRQALQAIGEEIGNLRAAWEWALEGRDMEALEALAAGLYLFYTIKGWHSEGDAAFRAAVNMLQRQRPPTRELDEQRRRVLARMLAYRAAFEIKIGRLDEAQTRLKKSLQLSRSINHTALMGFALDKMGKLADARGRYQRAAEYYTDALRFFELTGDEAGAAMALDHIGYAHYRMAAYAAAQEHFTRALHRYQRLQNEWGIANCLNNLGNIAFMQGEYFTARQHYLTSRSLRKSIGDRHGYATTSANLGMLERMQGNLNEAKAHLEEAVRTYAAIGDQRGRARIWITLGEIAAQEKAYTRARQLLQRSIATLESLGDENNAAFARAELALSDLRDGDVEAAHQRLNASLLFFRTCENRYGEGLTFARLARVYLRKRQREQARHALLEALSAVEETQVATLLHEVIIGAALWLHARAESGRALGLLQAWRQFSNLSPDVDNMLAEAWREIHRGLPQEGEATLPALPLPRSAEQQIALLRSLLGKAA